jgi:hypothetical protein
MKLDFVARILDGIPGVRKEGGGYVVPDDVEVSVFISLPSEVLTVPRCSRIEPAGELIVIETHKGERFHFTAQDVAGIKSAAAERSPSGRGAGFR